ncbi:hypothetical protein STCU_00542 [Strigomonas culicis]|uniref:Uncharacterized protein n=1 Tax=Strigomonas culicis TaxID=28005 RepID=S9WBN0_9TRYP|nr:hypothetical protein STCU_00542 [Strigomonas culicis]|eukprot:EPY36516.1 hypothetical protein STCU_00542 [Strigomonas culicis]
MATVAELQAQLAQLRTRHSAEVAAEEAKLKKLQQDMEYMLGDTEALEKEEKVLKRQFGSEAERGEPSEMGKYISNVIKGIIDGDDSLFV